MRVRAGGRATYVGPGQLFRSRDSLVLQTALQPPLAKASAERIWFSRGGRCYPEEAPAPSTSSLRLRRQHASRPSLRLPWTRRDHAGDKHSARTKARATRSEAGRRLMNGIPANDTLIFSTRRGRPAWGGLLAVGIRSLILACDAGAVIAPTVGGRCWCSTHQVQSRFYDTVRRRRKRRRGDQA